MSTLAAWAAAVFAVDPPALGGIRVRSAAGPRRDAWLAALRARVDARRPWLRLPLHIDDERLLGGLDLTATLTAGRPVAQRGLLAEVHGGVLLATMAERMTPGLAGRICSVLDGGELVTQRDGVSRREPAVFGLVVLDEGIEADERPPAALLERLALAVDLDADASDAADAAACPDDLPAVPPPASADWRAVTLDDGALRGLAATAAALGVASARATLAALRVARIVAVLRGRLQVEADDAALAAQLVLAPRATQLPAEAMPPESAAEPPPPAPPIDEDGPDDRNEDREPTAADAPLDDRLVEAALAALPPALLERLRAAAPTAARGGGAGRRGEWMRRSPRGRVIGARAGDPRDGARLHLMATLRAAAPWQRLRRDARDADLEAGAHTRPAATTDALVAPKAADPSTASLRGATPPASLTPHTPHTPPTSRTSRTPRPVIVQRDDLRVVRRRQRRSTTALFVLDASGSAALHRMAEAKGAVELLLADCYARRDRVAVLAFRGHDAQVLLPPTRSLVRAKRCLAALPGGGGTPLAAGIDAARALAESVQRGGGTPLVVLLTDGRANIARDGSPGRARAQDDALAAARVLANLGCATLLIDTAPQPSEPARALAAAMVGRYVALPHADARAMAGVVSVVMTGAAGRPSHG